MLLQEATVFSQKLRRMDRGLRALEAEAEVSGPSGRRQQQSAGTPRVALPPHLRPALLVLPRATLVGCCTLQAALESTKEVLSSPLPRHVAEEAGTGVSPEAVGGPGFNGDQVALVSERPLLKCTAVPPSGLCRLFGASAATTHCARGRADQHH